MSNAIQLGPLLLPFTLLLVIASTGVAFAVGRLLSRDAPAQTERTLWQALLAGLLAARLAFVYEYRSSYLESPLSILDVRDGGWNVAFGLVGAWLLVLHRGRGRHALQKAARWSLAAGTAVFLAGMAVLTFHSTSGARLPDLAFASLDGRTVRLADFEGKPTVVNLWATWCPPCVREMPVLDDAQRRHPDIQFVFLNQGEDAVRVARWLDGRQLSLRNVLLDPGRRASAAFGQRGYPATLFFNAQGDHVSTRIGELSRATLEERLQALQR